MRRSTAQHRHGRSTSRGRRLAAALLPAALGALGAAAIAVAPASVADVTPAAWQEMATPGVDASSELAGISCVSATDCTAVGYDATTHAPLVTHYDGTAWTSQTLPATDWGSALSGVSCPAAGGCTAVGYDDDGGLIMQESGGVWSVATVSQPSGAYIPETGLNAVSCADATHCVAVGTSAIYDEQWEFTYSEIWNGSTWSVNTGTPSPGSDINQLLGVSCVSASDCTAVGYAEYEGPEYALIAHFNGSSWSTMTGASISSTDNDLNAVSCLPGGDCTAVGHSDVGGVGASSLVERYDAASGTWSSLTAPDGGLILNSISCVTDTDCIAAGAGYSDSVNVFGWDDSSWSTIAAPAPGADQNLIKTVTCPVAGTCFGVGYRQESASDPAYPLIDTSIQQPQPVVATARATDATTLVLTGSGFTGATAVHFGDVSAPDFTVDSDTQITVGIPDGAPSGDVTVTTPVDTSVDWFADDYYAPPVVTGVSPGEGSDQGGDTVTVTGSGFTGATDVYFDAGEGGWDAPDFTVDSDSQLTVVTPASDWDGSTEIRVTGAGGTSGTSGDDWFTFGTPTTTTLDADQWTVYPNETATLSAIVDPIPNDGTVTFADGSGPLCQDVAVDPGSGIATCPVSYPSVRHATITASYSGSDDDYLPSSAKHEFVVDQQPTTASLDLPDSPTAGSSLRIGLTISPNPDRGTVAFVDNGQELPGCAARSVDEGYAYCDVTYGDVGDHDISAAYTGNADYSPATASGHFYVSAPDSTTDTTTTVTATPAQPQTGALVEYTATVDPAPGAGTVAFSDGGAAIATCGAVPVGPDGTATCVTTAGDAGGHTLRADYSGSTLYGSSTGSTDVTVQAVASGGGGGPTITSATLDVSDDPTAGQPVTYTLTVAPVPDDGTVTFADAGQAIPGCVELDLHAGVATCTTMYSTTGTHTIVAGYSGDGSYSASTARTQVTVGAPATKTDTDTTLQAAPHDAVTGQLVTLSVTVDPAPDGGTVEFDDGGSAISGCGAVTPDPRTGVARCQPVYGDPSTHTYAASYSGDTLYASSTSAEVDVTVTAPSGGGSGPIAVTTTLGVSPAHPAPGDTVTYTADLDPAPDAGTVSFTDAGDPIAHCSTVTVSDGQAQCVTSYTGGGTHTLTASYSGNAGYAPSTSGPLTLTVQAATTTAFTAGPTSVDEGDTNTYTVTVTPVPSGGTVAFTDGSTTITGCGAVPVNTTTGNASCSIAFSSTGAHTLSATYSGATGYLTSSTTQTVTVLIPVTVSAGYGLTSDWQYSYTASYGCGGGGLGGEGTCYQDVHRPAWDVTLAAQVSPAVLTGSLGGTVTFTSAAGGTSLGCTTAISSSGYGSCTIPAVSPGAPAHVTVSYAGDATHLPATSGAIEVDLPYTSATIVSASTTTPAPTDTVTLTASVKRTLDDYGSTSSITSGTVSFTDGGTAITGCTDLSLVPNGYVLNGPSGTVTCTTSFATSGAHQVQAAFSGTSTDEASSAQVEVDVTGTVLVPPSAPAGTTHVQSAVSTSVTGKAEASSGGVDVAGSGKGALTLGQYPLRPSGVTDLSGKYFDLKLAKGSAFKSVSVKDCNLGGATTLYFWTGTAWVAASNQVYDGTHTPPCVTVTIGPRTTPSLAQLTGTVFGSGPATLRETPTLSATSTSAGRVTVTVSTHPAVAGRMVTVYRVAKRHGHKATLVAVGHARTGTAGRVTLRLTLPAGSTARLRARMSGKDHVERLSPVVTVHVRSRTGTSEAPGIRAE